MYEKESGNTYEREYGERNMGGNMYEREYGNMYD